MAGRIIWHLFAERLGVIPKATTPTALLALVTPATIVLAVLVAAGPTVTAVRTRPAPVLREE